MPRFVPEETGSGPVVQGIADGGFKVDGLIHRAVTLTPERAEPWTAPALDALTLDMLEPLLALRPELILIGTGRNLRRPPAALVAAIEARGIGVEPMDSRAAARAWVILRGEERYVVAALMPLDA